MPQTTLTSTSAPKEVTLKLRLDATLKSEFVAATEAEHQTRLISASKTARAEEADAMRWVENVSTPMPVESDDEWFVTPPRSEGIE
jgi:hypothetical protein